MGWRCVLTWQADGNDYEAAISGLGDRLTDEQVLSLLGAWRTRSHAVITGDVVDAEKQTNRLSWQSGTWLVNDTEDRPEFWGDASMCWAAAASNMLWSSGWARQAVNPLTGSAFASEDEVFTLFTHHFNDRKGGWSAHGIRWFFTGSADMLDLSERFSDTLKTSIEGYDPQDYQHGSMNEENPVWTAPTTMAEFAGLIRRLKDGAAVGISVGFNEERYHLPEWPEDTVLWNVQKGCFLRDKLVENVVKADCMYSPYWFSKDGDPLPLTEQDGNYMDENGQIVDPKSVLQGYLYQAEGQWWLAEEFGDGDEVLVMVEYEVPEELVAGSEMEQFFFASHSHALTLTGYVMNLSAKDPGDMVEALFIANSDNDAALWQITPDTLPREQRPNTYDMYPVSVHACDDGLEQRTLCLEQFMEHNLTLVNNIVTLDAFQ